MKSKLFLTLFFASSAILSMAQTTLPTSPGPNSSKVVTYPGTATNGGNLDISSGLGSSASGNVNITSAGGNTCGNINITAGSPNGDYKPGGNITLQAGNIGDYSSAGHIYIKPGNSGTYASPGSIYLYPPARGYVYLGNTSSFFDVSGNSLKIAGYVNASSYQINGTAVKMWNGAGTNVYYSAGNVGIGTTNPTKKLEVAGDNIGTAIGAKLEIGNGEDMHGGDINLFAGDVGYGGAGSITLKPGKAISYGASGTISLLSSKIYFGDQDCYLLGNILNISGQIDTENLRSESICIGNGEFTNKLRIFTTTSLGLTNVNYSNAAMRIDDAAGSLYIDGNQLFSTENLYFASRDGIFTFGQLDANNNFQSLMKIDGNGKLQIKEVEVKATIAANSIKSDNIRANQLTLDMPNAADYVFDPSYTLRSLDEVEEFVSTNKHLPGMPSAAEFKENGVNMAEMNNLLLEKVEELTLYMIELKKQNEILSQRVEDLEGK